MSGRTLTITIPVSTLEALASGWCTAVVEVANADNGLRERWGLDRVVIEAIGQRSPERILVMADATPGAGEGECSSCPD